MDVRNCKGCGKLFNYSRLTPMCASCMKQLEDKFHDVKEYIYNNPEANIQQVAEENEISIQQLKKWVREERLQFSESSMVGLECESCGKLIKTGRYCVSCKDKMANNLGDIYKEQEVEVNQPKKTNPKMRFLD